MYDTWPSMLLHPTLEDVYKVYGQVGAWCGCTAVGQRTRQCTCSQTVAAGDAECACCDYTMYIPSNVHSSFPQVFGANWRGRAAVSDALAAVVAAREPLPLDLMQQVSVRVLRLACHHVGGPVLRRATAYRRSVQGLA